MGVSLLASGLVYTIIGIKNRWLYISMSAAYLTSLAVTVLIIYVMNPPVSDAVQGAFFVAACVTGLILGALALIFQDVTEGLGCLLGGFCLSMWFLSVREGSLIRSGTGRAIFIGVMSCVAFSLSFSRYTRTYGLIVCIAFAGATAMVLGIDCFSCAGLKEFWIYIWNINSDLFPLHTETYPITRGIRVEIACTIVFFIFGLMSQFRLWKVIKERRQKKEVERRERDDSLERMEEEAGRRIENNLGRERAEWEAVYGDKRTKANGASSSDDSMHKGSLSVKDARRISSDSIEMDDLGSVREESRQGLMARGSSKKNGASRVTVRVAQDDDIHQIDPQGNLIQALNEASSRNSIHHGSSSTSEALVVPHIEDDARSSVAATFDEIDEDRISLPALSPPTSPVANGFEKDLLAPPSPNKRPRSLIDTGEPTSELPTRSAMSEGDTPIEPHDADILKTHAPSGADEDPAGTAELRKSLTASTDPKANDKRKRLSLANQQGQSVLSGTRREDAKSASRKSGPASDVSEDVVVRELVKENLPANVSKVVLSYRTNEWAKHLEAAERPQFDELEPASPGMRVDNGFKEAAAPVPEALLPASNNPFRHSMGRPPSGSPKIGFPDGAPGTTTPPSHNSSATRLVTRGLRNSSTPLINETLVESPIEERHSPADIIAPSPLPSGTLLGRREGILRSKPQSTSFMPYMTPYPSGSTPSVAVIAPSDSASVRGLNLDLEPDSDNISLSSRKQQLLDSSGGENMSLAERKALIQRQQAAQLQAQAQAQILAQQRNRQGTWPLLPDAQHLPNSGAALRQTFNSHQPRRSSGIDPRRQETTLANWRSSLALDKVPAGPIVVDEGRRAAMLAEQRQRQIAALQEQSAREYRDGMAGG
ncbi:hypothetical protein H2199_004541 [Coniosporium tulheliwenetii]|uniref:Uncharacterized protein n=1 Tax=Coniosporium tulheliwenetii TaxID=3383036 RepID=A0ACC2Z708_9PEZI|nr:hypothetical protein H2199_004541 [Cladosporium sp. JES 115]